MHAMTVVTSARPGGLSATVAYMAAALGAYGFRFVHTAGFLQPPFPIPAAWQEENKKKIRTAARVFHAACRSTDLPLPSLKEVSGFRFMQLFLRKVRGASFETFYPADCAYWQEKGWLDTGRYYFTEEKIGIFKIIIGLQLAKCSAAPIQRRRTGRSRIVCNKR